MAKYVLIAFDNNDEAEAFIGTIVTAGQAPSIEILGVYQKPTLFCECAPEAGDEDRSVRGAKYGLWVHKPCGKPHKGSWQSPMNLLRTDEHTGRRKLNLQLVEPQPADYERRSS